MYGSASRIYRLAIHQYELGRPCFGRCNWLANRSRFRTTIAELNTKLALERRVNKQLYEKAQIDAVAGSMGASNLTTSGEPARQPMAVSG